MVVNFLNPDRQITSIVFIDGSFPDLQSVLSGLDPSFTAIVFDPAQDGNTLALVTHINHKREFQ